MRVSGVSALAVALLCSSAAAAPLKQPESVQPEQMKDGDQKEESNEKVECEDVKVKVVATKYGSQNSLKLDKASDKPIHVFSNGTLGDHTSQTFGSVCLAVGRHTADLSAEYGDGWHGGYLVFSNVNTGRVYAKVGHDFTGGRYKTYSFHVKSEKPKLKSSDDDDDEEEEAEDEDEDDIVTTQDVAVQNVDPWPSAGDTKDIIFAKEPTKEPRASATRDAKHSDGILYKDPIVSEQGRREAVHLRHLGLKRRKMRMRKTKMMKAE